MNLRALAIRAYQRGAAHYPGTRLVVVIGGCCEEHVAVLVKPLADLCENSRGLISCVPARHTPVLCEIGDEHDVFALPVEALLVNAAGGVA